jgi:hypothetical protein
LDVLSGANGSAINNQNLVSLNYISGFWASNSTTIAPITPVAGQPVTIVSAPLACSVSDIYAVQASGFNYYNIYMKVNNLPRLDNTITSVGNVTIDGADSWNNLVFNLDGAWNLSGPTMLKSNQTVNSTGAGYILARKSAIHPTYNGTMPISCSTLK